MRHNYKVVVVVQVVSDMLIEQSCIKMMDLDIYYGVFAECLYKAVVDLFFVIAYFTE